jgi:exodeoxyribonuclease V gamma subunit
VFHLTVAPSIEHLIDPLAEELSRPLTDPFAAEVVAVPGDGVRSWLTARLAERLGHTGSTDGVVANVSFVFPSQLVARAIGRVTPSGPWSVGSLTWAVYDVLHDPSHDHAAALGVTADAVRCRSIADLFDRYALHRPRMVRAWEGGRDIDGEGRPLPSHLVWQPGLWRLVRERLGIPSDVELLVDAAARLRTGRLQPSLPDRVFLVGLAGLPAPHLHVVSALSTQRAVYVLAPAPSLAVWERLHDRVRRHPLALPLARADDPTTAAAAHPLGLNWGRFAREAHLLLADAAVDSGAVVRPVRTIGAEHSATSDEGDTVEGDTVEGDTVEGDTVEGDTVENDTLLGRLQRDLRFDRPPPGQPAQGELDLRLRLRSDDSSLQWHTCHGPTRQAEVLRDVVVRLLEETHAGGSPQYEPRDITVLCPDVGTYAPLLRAAFVGDREHGIPPIPLRVADRSLRQENPLLDAVADLLELLDGRFRASGVLAFAALDPVALRFGFGPEQLERMSAWVAATNVRWGADPDSHRSAGLPEGVDAYTWRHGLDQLLVGAALADGEMVEAAGDPAVADRRFGPGATVAAADIDAAALATAGALAELVRVLDLAVRSLADAPTLEEWCDALARAADALFEVPDDASWQRRDLDVELGRFADESRVGDEPLALKVPSTDLATLFGQRLAGRPGRARFGTGAVTLSSLTAQRGVPHPVVCLLGLDGDLGSSAVAMNDDLTQATPCVGDRDPRAETRAQLLDALLAAGDRLVMLSTGRDVRTNASVPAIVPLAELLDVVDATAVGPDGGRAVAAIQTQHPRQAWAEANFVSGGPSGSLAGPWSFDRGALAAALARRGQRHVAPFLERPLAARPGAEVVAVRDLERTVKNPVETLVRDRLGASFGAADQPLGDLVPMAVGGLERWKLCESLAAARLAAGEAWNDHALERWSQARRREGSFPPLARGEMALADVCAEVDGLMNEFQQHCGAFTHVTPIDVVIDHQIVEGSTHGIRHVRGLVPGVRGHLVVHLSPSRLRAHLRLVAWIRLALLTLTDPHAPWEAVTIGRPATANGGPQTHRVRLVDPAVAADVLDVVLDLHDRCRRDVIPAFPRTTYALRTAAPGKGPDRAAYEWNTYTGGGEGQDDWVLAALGAVELADLLDDPARPDEAWGPGASRLEQWGERIWGTYDSTTCDPAAGR